MSLKEFLKSDEQRIKEEVARASEVLRISRETFAKDAIAAGFTPDQVQVMVTYLSVKEHFHNYYGSPHWRITQ